MLVVGMNLKDVENAKRMELVPREAKYLPTYEIAMGYKSETVYAVHWPQRWHRENIGNTKLHTRMTEVGAMIAHLRYSGCEIIRVTLP